MKNNIKNHQKMNRLTLALRVNQSKNEHVS